MGLVDGTATKSQDSRAVCNEYRLKCSRLEIRLRQNV
jgi:hypothetical protein